MGAKVGKNVLKTKSYGGKIFAEYPSRVGGLNNQRALQPRSPLRKVILAQGEQDDYLARLRRVAE